MSIYDKYSFSLRIAGNTQNPALTILKDKGYQLWVEEHSGGRLSWNADQKGRLFSATGPVELLGLVTLWEVRGDDWHAKDHEDDVCDYLFGEA